MKRLSEFAPFYILTEFLWLFGKMWAKWSPCWNRSPSSIVVAIPRHLPRQFLKIPPTRSTPPALSTPKKVSCTVVLIWNTSLLPTITIHFYPLLLTSTTNLPTLPSLPTILLSPAIVPGNPFCRAFFTGRWVCYAEKKTHALVPFLSTTKSAQQVRIPRLFEHRSWGVCFENCFPRWRKTRSTVGTFLSHRSCPATIENSWNLDRIVM